MYNIKNTGIKALCCISLLSVLLVVLLSGCTEQPIDEVHEIDKEYKIYRLEFLENYERVKILSFVNDSIVEKRLKIITYGEAYDDRYNGILIIDDRSYLKLISVQRYQFYFMGFSIGESIPISLYEIHLTEDDFVKYSD